MLIYPDIIHSSPCLARRAPLLLDGAQEWAFILAQTLGAQAESLDGVIAGASLGKPAFEENELGYRSLAEIAPLERRHERPDRLFGRFGRLESGDGEMRIETPAFREELVLLHRFVRGSLQARQLVGNGIDANPNDPRTLRVGETPAATQREAERLTTTDTLWKRLDERSHNRRLDLPKETKREMQILRTNPSGPPG